MRLKPFDGLNPADAYRLHGARYSFFVFAKAAALILNLILAVATLAATFADPALYLWCEKIANITLKLVGMAIPFLSAEAMYWWYRLRRVSQTSNSAHAAEQIAS